MKIALIFELFLDKTESSWLAWVKEWDSILNQNQSSVENKQLQNVQPYIGHLILFLQRLQGYQGEEEQNNSKNQTL